MHRELVDRAKQGDERPSTPWLAWSATGAWRSRSGSCATPTGPRTRCRPRSSRPGASCGRCATPTLRTLAPPDPDPRVLRRGQASHVAGRPTSGSCRSTGRRESGEHPHRRRSRPARAGLPEAHARATRGPRLPSLPRAAIARGRDRLGIPLGTAKSRLHHATTALRASLEADARTPSIRRSDSHDRDRATPIGSSGPSSTRAGPSCRIAPMTRSEPTSTAHVNGSSSARGGHGMPNIATFAIGAAAVLIVGVVGLTSPSGRRAAPDSRPTRRTGPAWVDDDQVAITVRREPGADGRLQLASPSPTTGSTCVAGASARRPPPPAGRGAPPGPPGRRRRRQSGPAHRRSRSSPAASRRRSSRPRRRSRPTTRPRLTAVGEEGYFVTLRPNQGAAGVHGHRAASRSPATEHGPAQPRRIAGLTARTTRPRSGRCHTTLPAGIWGTETSSSSSRRSSARRRRERPIDIAQALDAELRSPAVPVHHRHAGRRRAVDVDGRMLRAPSSGASASGTPRRWPSSVRNLGIPATDRRRASCPASAAVPTRSSATTTLMPGSMIHLPGTLGHLRSDRWQPARPTADRLATPCDRLTIREPMTASTRPLPW